MKYPIAETFQSIQGEGALVGTSMFFIRFAGCNVGQKIRSEDRVEGLPKYIERCQTLIGEESFLCDTNFQISHWLTLDELLLQIPRGIRVCLTGGEPLIHDLDPLVRGLIKEGHLISLETSGTLPFSDTVLDNCWITIAPKVGCRPDNLQLADEIKILIDNNVKEIDIETLVQGLPPVIEIFIQPINFEASIDRQNLAHCLDILSRHPTWKLSVQLHKFLQVR